VDENSDRKTPKASLVRYKRTQSDQSSFFWGKGTNIALPPAFVKQFGVVLGDFASVMNQANGKSAYAIYADVGPRGEISEGSVVLAKALGFKDANPRYGGVSGGIRFLVFRK